MTYEETLMLCDEHGLTVKELPLEAHDGLILGSRVAIRSNIPTSAEKSQVAAEELAHSMVTVGNILDQDNIFNLKMEMWARSMAYDLKIGLEGLINAYNAGCRNWHEVADYLDCTEDFLREAVERYREKYGICVDVNEYTVYFEPRLAVIKYN